jgi:hypothetical protein
VIKTMADTKILLVVIKTMADYKYMPLKWSHSLSTSLKEIMLFNVLDSKTS